LFQYPELITLPAKGDTAAVIVKAEHRLEEKNASFPPKITTVRPIAPLNFHNDSGKPSSAAAAHVSHPSLLQRLCKTEMQNNLSQQILIHLRQLIKQVV
jgi:hypothetical protein